MHDWKQVIRRAYKHNIIGRPEYVWIGAEEKKWTGSAFQLDRNTEEDLAKALHGVGTINLYFEPMHRFNVAMDAFAFDSELQQEFVAAQADPHIFDNYTFPQYDPTGFTNSIFDSVMALGIAACSIDNSSSGSNDTDLFTGDEFHQTLLQTEFNGVSGHVQFDPSTGTRTAGGLKHSIEYVLLSDGRSDENAFRFHSNMVAVIHDDNILNFHPFVYHDNTTVRPPALPPIEGEVLNLLPLWAQIYGYLLGGLIMMVSIGWFVWVCVKRSVFIVRASQPFFLCQLCVGTFIMGTATIPASFPGASLSFTHDTYNPLNHLGHTHQGAEQTKGMDVACMSTLWLVVVGFTISFSALSSKIWRLSMLMELGSAMRHHLITVKQSLKPFYISMSVNVVLLLCITIFTPLRYQRVLVQGNVDSFGRPLESYGTCQPAASGFYYLLAVILIANVAGILYVIRQAYVTRDLPAAFSDATSLSLAVLSLLETLIVGTPLLVVVQGDPTTYYLVASSMLCLCCLGMLMILFIPKYNKRHYKHRLQSVVNAMTRVASNRSDQSVLSRTSGNINLNTGAPSSRRMRESFIPSFSAISRAEGSGHLSSSATGVMAIRREDGSTALLR
eukprot:Sro7_g006370.2  (614) ;mRNA; r:250087-251928